ncbi:hypothetical protein [Methylomicrobium album]|uniref:Lipoprotein n=1 Tax=Methylomicrobium album BG8 TaxID=686340 RepID=H8GHS0_METAL|nr:hypothetical protein [Methylomicrobium album]EIC31388.1 hypothetical protein Metal_3743 [Methylomicrobium album BG8]
MKMCFRRSFIVFALLALLGCAKRLDDASSGISIGETYYAQVSFQYEKGRHLTTNYRRGILVPVNTPVRLEDIASDEIFVELLPSHAKLRVVNVEKHTGDSTARAFAKLFGKNKLDLSRFSKLEQENIPAGKVAKSMSKKAVIAAIGYPPITETPNLSMNQWTYWSSRFNRFIVHFENDRVARIQD